MSLLQRVTRTALFVVLALLVSTVSADTIYLRNGRVYSGKILNQTPKAVLLKTATGTTTVPKDQIRRITYESFEEAVAKERARLARLAALRRAKEAERKKREDEERRQRELAEARAAKLAFEKQQALARSQRAAFLREQVAKGKIKRDDISEPIEFWDFAWRSVAFPGWGHYYMGKRYFGIAYSLGFIALLANTYSLRVQATAAQAANEEQATNNALLSASTQSLSPEVRAAAAAYAINANANYLGRYKTRINRYNASLGAIVLFYGVQALHIVLDGLTWESGGLLGSADGAGTSFDLAVLPEPAGEFRSSSHPFSGPVRVEVGFTTRF